MTKSQNKKALTVAGLAVAMAVSTVPALAGPEEDAFAKAGYNMCDAKVLGAYYGDKLVKRVVFGAGEKIHNGDADIIAEDFINARKEQEFNVALCPAEEFYSADEIKLYMTAMDLGTVSEASKKISENLIYGYKEDVDQQIEFARP